MYWCKKLTAAAIVACIFTSQLRAQDYFWLGGTGTLDSANFTQDGVTPVTPPQAATSILHIGNSGTVTYSGPTNPITYGKLRIGHNHPASPGTPILPGSGTVTISGGMEVKLDANTGTGVAHSNLWVGAGNNGTLNIDGAGTIVRSALLAVIGYGDDVTKTAILNITNGGSLVVTDRNMVAGDREGTTGGGIPGQIIVSGTGSSLNVNGTGADLNLGAWATSSLTQTDGIINIADQVIVGQRNTDGTTMNISGGAFFTGGQLDISTGTAAQGNSDNVSVTFSGTAVGTIGGTIQLGSNASRNATLTVTGTAQVTSTGLMTVGVNSALNSRLVVSGNGVLSPGGNVTLGSNTADGSSLTIADNADVNILGAGAAGNLFVGRGTSSNTTFTMTGGTLDLGNLFLMGTGDTTTGTGTITNIVGNHSGGTITSVSNFVVNDTRSQATYNLSGTGVINAGNNVNIGRQSGSGVMNQTGGTLNAANCLFVGNAGNADTTLWSNGTYNISAGTITAAQTTNPNALSIAPQGTGTFRVIGDDATVIDINGNMLVNAGGGAQGTLAYQLETGDLLSLIDVSGTATFNNGAILNFDTSLATPTQATYDLVTALDIIDNGLLFNGPAGWGYQIIPGGNGEILQLYQPPVVSLHGDFNSDGKVDAGDYVTWRKNDGTNNALANDNGLGVPVRPAHYELWRANFGNPPGSGSGGGLSGAAVPEPASLLLLVSAAVGLMCSRRR